LFTLGSAPRAEFPCPLLILAATRGKLMELTAHALRPADRDFHDRAFMTGILSLVPALGLPVKEVVGPIPVGTEVKRALPGPALGHMLMLVEALEVDSRNRDGARPRPRPRARAGHQPAGGSDGLGERVRNGAALDFFPNCRGAGP
jgi:hypothetical protein